MDKETKAYLDKQFKQLWSAMDGRFKKIEKTLNEHGRKFDRVDERLTTLEKRMGALEHRMDGLDHRMDIIEQRWDTIDKRLMIVEKRLHMVEKGSYAINDTLAEVQKRLAKVEAIQLRMEHKHGDQLSGIWDKVSQFDGHIKNKAIHVQQTSFE